MALRAPLERAQPGDWVRERGPLGLTPPYASCPPPSHSGQLVMHFLPLSLPASINTQVHMSEQWNQNWCSSCCLCLPRGKLSVHPGATLVGISGWSLMASKPKKKGCSRLESNREKKVLKFMSLRDFSPPQIQSVIRCRSRGGFSQQRESPPHLLLLQRWMHVQYVCSTGKASH